LGNDVNKMRIGPELCESEGGERFVLGIIMHNVLKVGKAEENIGKK